MHAGESSEWSDLRHDFKYNETMTAAIAVLLPEALSTSNSLVQFCSEKRMKIKTEKLRRSQCKWMAILCTYIVCCVVVSLHTDGSST